MIREGLLNEVTLPALEIGDLTFSPVLRLHGRGCLAAQGVDVQPLKFPADPAVMCLVRYWQTLRTRSNRRMSNVTV